MVPHNHPAADKGTKDNRGLGRVPSRASKPCFFTESQMQPKRPFCRDIHPSIFLLSRRKKGEKRERAREGSSSLLLFLVGCFSCCFWVCILVMAMISLLVSHWPGPWESDAVCTSEGKQCAQDWPRFRPSFGYIRNSKSLFLEGVKKRLPFSLINTVNNSHVTVINMSLTSRDLRSTKKDWENNFRSWVPGI